MTKPKTVLVTGASGFIGSTLVSEMKKEGWDVISAVRLPTTVNEVHLDLTDIESIKAFKSGKPLDAIVHLAAKVEFDNASIDDLYGPNVKATSELLGVAKYWNALFVFSSSALIAHSQSTYITSDSLDSPDFAYLQSKLLAEDIINSSEVKSAILRIGGVYGLNGPPHLGLNRAISCLVKGERPAQYGDGSAMRNYIYVKDLAGIFMEVLEKNVNGLHLIAGNEEYSIANMLQLLCDKFIPGEKAHVLDGGITANQLIEPSLYLPGSYSYVDAVDDMYEDSLT